MTWLNRPDSPKAPDALLALLASFSAALVLHLTFFHFARDIWLRASHISPELFAPPMRPHLVERDGIEPYVLYVMAFAGMALTLILMRFRPLLESSTRRTKLAVLFPSALFLGTLFFFTRVGFRPPMQERGSFEQSLAVFAAMAVLLTLLAILAKWNGKFAFPLLFILFIPSCSVGIDPISTYDYAFIFMPSLRMFHHAPLSSIYFQYDFLLSYLGFIWLKLGLAVNDFQWIVRLSFFLLFVGICFLGNRLFLRKQLGYYLLVSLVLVKYYALLLGQSLIQVGPLRLDLWIILLLLAYQMGYQSLLVGLALGGLLVVHHTFGALYAFAYIELAALMFFVEVLDRRGTGSSFFGIAKSHLFRNLPNLGLILLGALAYQRIFGNSSSEALAIYEGLGVGFMRIINHSFYWHMFVLLNLTVYLLIRGRNAFPSRYFETGVFLIVLTVANSVYFYGRSHENNILNIAAPFILMLFLVFDMLNRSVADTPRLMERQFVHALPALFIVFVGYYYSDHLFRGAQIQLQGMETGRYIFPLPQHLDVNAIRVATHDERKIYFMSGDDFYYCLDGGYEPRGHWLPYGSWVYKKDLVSFLQGLADEGYVLAVSDNYLSQREIVSSLTLDRQIKAGKFTLYARSATLRAAKGIGGLAMAGAGWSADNAKPARRSP